MQMNCPQYINPTIPTHILVRVILNNASLLGRRLRRRPDSVSRETSLQSDFAERVPERLHDDGVLVLAFCEGWS